MKSYNHFTQMDICCLFYLLNLGVICGYGSKLVKVREIFTEKLNIIPERIYVEKHIYPVYACRNYEGSGDEDHPVFRQAPAAKNIIQQGIETPGLLSYIFINKYCNRWQYTDIFKAAVLNSFGRS